MSDNENFDKLRDALTHISERIEIQDNLDAEMLGYILSTAPLGSFNAALEGAIATARFLADQSNKEVYMDRLKYWSEAATLEEEQ